MSLARVRKWWRAHRRPPGSGPAKTGGSSACEIRDPGVIRPFLDNPDFPFLVSFPRTGSHWLRMLMELAFGRPSLVRVFFYPDRRDYLAFHSHDIPGDQAYPVERRNVLYLYRDPVDTVFSQLRFHGEDPADAAAADRWASLYGAHLAKWLLEESFTRRKTILTYETMRENLPAEFARVAAHLDQPFDATRLAEAAAWVDKERLKTLVGSVRPEVVRTEDGYDEARRAFRAARGGAVWRAVLAGRPGLAEHFAHLPAERRPEAFPQARPEARAP